MERTCISCKEQFDAGRGLVKVCKACIEEARQQFLSSPPTPKTLGYFGDADERMRDERNN